MLKRWWDYTLCGWIPMRGVTEPWLEVRDDGPPQLPNPFDYEYPRDITGYVPNEPWGGYFEGGGIGPY